MMAARALLPFALGLVMASAGMAQGPGAPPAESVAAAATPGDVTRATRLFSSLMSPFCPGLTLANCPSVYAETLRVSVRNRLAAGEHPDSIVESLVVAFGERVRGAPRARGIGVALWALPFALLAVGGAGVGWWLRRRGVWVAAVPDGKSPRTAPVEPTPDELAQLEDALREDD